MSLSILHSTEPPNFLLKPVAPALRPAIGHGDYRGDSNSGRGSGRWLHRMVSNSHRGKAKDGDTVTISTEGREMRLKIHNERLDTPATPAPHLAKEDE